nr:sigma 54-interacting transcriptional regulator [Anaerovorax odorimutans]
MDIAKEVEILKTAFESSYDGIHILDSDGNTLYINSACTRIEGISKEEAMNRTIKELVANGVYSESVTLKVLETKAPTTIIQTAKNGSQLLSTGTPTFKEDGSIDKVIVNSRDITALNELKRELSVKEELARQYRVELELLKKEHGKQADLIAKSPAMQKIIRLALNVAKVDSTVLITGESGVGKGVLAEFIHNNSACAEGPFIKIDCSSIPESLFESELFGYEKGAFTGAERTGKAGLLELANGGTVFLDEIGEMPLSMQPKLMRAIQHREIVPVGGKLVKKLDLRIIAATNVDLAQKVRDKEFREDLYYRLNVVPIRIPALRERKEDILPLILRLMEKLNEHYGFHKHLTEEVKDTLLEYEWPGNIRELENVIERILVSTQDDIIDSKSLPSHLTRGKTGDFPFYKMTAEDYKTALAKYDAHLLKQAVQEAGSIPKAAQKLGVDATTIRRKMARYGKLLKEE